MASNERDAWSRWRHATLAAERGQLKYAITELSDLYNHSTAFDPDFRRSVAYSYGVTLLMASTAHEGLRILRELRQTKGYGSSRFNLKDTTTEISAAYNVLGNHGAAKKEAHAAITLLKDDSDPLPFFHLG